MEPLKADNISEMSFESGIVKQKHKMQSPEAVRRDSLELSKRYSFKMDDLRIQPNDHISEAGSVDTRAIRYGDIEREYEVEQ